MIRINLLPKDQQRTEWERRLSPLYDAGRWLAKTKVGGATILVAQYLGTELSQFRADQKSRSSQIALTGKAPNQSYFLGKGELVTRKDRLLAEQSPAKEGKGLGQTDADLEDLLVTPNFDSEEENGPLEPQPKKEPLPTDPTSIAIYILDQELEKQGTRLTRFVGKAGHFYSEKPIANGIVKGAAVYGLVATCGEGVSWATELIFGQTPAYCVDLAYNILAPMTAAGQFKKSLPEPEQRNWKQDASIPVAKGAALFSATYATTGNSYLATAVAGIGTALSSQKIRSGLGTLYNAMRGNRNTKTTTSE